MIAARIFTRNLDHPELHGKGPDRRRPSDFGSVSIADFHLLRGQDTDSGDLDHRNDGSLSTSVTLDTSS